MDCKKVQERINAFLDGELDVDEEQEIRNHVPNCIRCLRTVAEHWGIQSLLSNHRIDDPPDSLKESVMEEVKSPSTNSKPTGDHAGLYRRFSQAAVLLLGVLLGLALSLWALPPNKTSDFNDQIDRRNASIEVLTVRPTGSLSKLVSPRTDSSPGGKL